ncbi:MAG: acyl-CoA thioesterase [Verrucomicrobiales bacterium]|nr:acyl-CoA thioesterase [Verrucomicrobiales bacterium]
MASEYSITRSVEFSETDMAGIMHYSNFFRYMEAAEHAFFRSLGYSVAARPGQPKVGWPRVHASCDYRRPLRFEDEVEVRMRVVEKRSKALTYEFAFWKRLPGGSAEEVAKGRLTVVCVVHRPDGSLEAATIPAEIADRIEVAPEPEPA